MRLALGGVLLTIGLLGCGGDSSDPDEPFPDVAGVYEVEGTFDDLPANDASSNSPVDSSPLTPERSIRLD